MIVLALTRRCSACQSLNLLIIEGIFLERLYGSRKRTLVTSGVGFLGSHLIDRLLGMTLEVLCVDNLFADAKRNMRNHKRLKFMRHNLTSALC